MVRVRVRGCTARALARPHLIRWSCPSDTAKGGARSRRSREEEGARRDLNFRGNRSRLPAQKRRRSLRSTFVARLCFSGEGVRPARKQQRPPPPAAPRPQEGRYAGGGEGAARRTSRRSRSSSLACRTPRSPPAYVRPAPEPAPRPIGIRSHAVGRPGRGRRGGARLAGGSHSLAAEAQAGHKKLGAQRPPFLRSQPGAIAAKNTITSRALLLAATAQARPPLRCVRRTAPTDEMGPSYSPRRAAS